MFPGYEARPHLRGIVSPSPAERSTAWRWFTTPSPGARTPRLDRWYPIIERHLIDSAGNDAMLDAIVVLETHNLLGWHRSRLALMAKCVAALQAAGGDHLGAARDLLASAPEEFVLPKQIEQGTIRK